MVSFIRAAKQLSIGALVALSLAGTAAWAEDATTAIQQVLEQSMKDKRGVTLWVEGQTIGGGVAKLEPGQWVELKSQQFGKIIVRIERIDAVGMP